MGAQVGIITQINSPRAVSRPRFHFLCEPWQVPFGSPWQPCLASKIKSLHLRCMLGGGKPVHLPPGLSPPVVSPHPELPLVPFRLVPSHIESWEGWDGPPGSCQPVCTEDRCLCFGKAGLGCLPARECGSSVRGCAYPTRPKMLPRHNPYAN